MDSLEALRFRGSDDPEPPETRKIAEQVREEIFGDDRFSRVTVIVETGKQMMMLVIPKAQNVTILEFPDMTFGGGLRPSFDIKGDVVVDLGDTELPRLHKSWPD